MKKQLLAALIAGEIGSAVLAWRDLDRRPDSAVRGRKRVWRIAMLANPGNSLAYWALGRHQTSADTDTRLIDASSWLVHLMLVRAGDWSALPADRSVAARWPRPRNHRPTDRVHLPSG